MMLCISIKFHENILNRFLVIERTRNYHYLNSKGNIPKVYKPKFWFLCSARCLIMHYISMKFHENIFAIVEFQRGIPPKM